jgi:CheY-like chemotaxis protein
MMKLLLEMYGYEALEAADGREAVQKAAECHPDLILMDIMMPYLDGIEATRAIRKLEGIGNIPIVAITAYDDIIYDRALDAGFTAVLSKPLFFDEFKLMLDRLLKPAVKGRDGH